MTDPPANPTTYLETRNKLKADLKRFIEEASKETRKASELVKTTYTEKELSDWHRQTMKKTLSNWSKESRADFELIVKQRDKLKKMRKKQKSKKVSRA